MINNWYLLFIKTERNLMVQIGTVHIISGTKAYHKNIDPKEIDENTLYYLGNDEQYHKLK